MYSVKTQLSISNVRVLQKLSPNTKRSIRQLEKTHRLSFNIFLCSFYRFLSLSLSLFKNSFYFVFLVLSSFVIFSCFFFLIFSFVLSSRFHLGPIFEELLKVCF